MTRQKKTRLFGLLASQRTIGRYGCISAALLAAVLTIGTAVTPVHGESGQVWIGPDGKPLPFKTNDEIEEFLLAARVVEMEEIPVGITDPRRALLEKDGIELNACYRDVDIHRRQEMLPGIGVRRNWRDCCKFECAAYELGKLLGLNNIP